MVSVAEWKDFPKGLRVLVLDEDSEAAAEIKSRLEGFEYVVSTFSNETEALAVLANETNSFHVALVEVSTGNSCGGFRFLQTACNIPTVMMSNRSCLSTTMKCIALGASEFLQKPISEDKLKNIWQHVVHKAFSESGTVLSKSLKPVKATIVSMLQLGHEHDNVKSKSSQNGDSSVGNKAEADALHKVQSCMPTRTDSIKQESSIEPCNSEKFPAPSTPQLEQGGRSPCEEDKTLRLDDTTNLMVGPAHPDTNCGDETIREVRLDAEATSTWSSQVDSPASVKKESQDMSRISLKARISTQSGVKPADLTRDQLGNGITSRGTCLHSGQETADVHVVSASGITEEEVGSAEGSKSDDENIETEAILSSYVCIEENVDSSTENIKEKRNSAEHGCKKSNISSSKKKFKVEWTMDLHRRFVQAVEQLGVDQAIPSRILDLMKVDGLTRHNVASHLQKYRSHRRHILPRDDELASRRYWQHFDPAWTRTKQDESWSRTGNPASGPILAYSPVQLHSTPHGTPVGPPLHVWGHPTIDQSGSHMWQQLQVGTPTTWQAQDGSFWKHPGVYADAWGCPTVGMPFYPQPMMKLPSNHGHRSTPKPNSTIQGVSVQYPATLDPLNESLLWEKSINEHPPKEVIDEAFKEALNNPWTPLPLGLKPPSMESVMAELQRQGINKIPPPAS